jgi:arylsulfatase A-like enzyme
MTKADSRCARTVDFMSIYPTLAELCGFESPAHLEGKSIVSLLKNPQAKWNSPAICTFNYNNHAVRTEQWRYIRYNQGEEELYDEKKDPYEWKNLAKAARSAKVKTQLQQWLPKVNNNQKVGNDGGATEN